MIGLISFLIICALIDSLNPVTIAIHIYLLTTDRPIVRTISFMMGMFSAYFIGGVLIEFGLDKIITDFDFNPNFVFFIIEIIIGCLLIVSGYKYSKKVNVSTTKKPRSLKAIHTFLLGLFVTGSDIPTALPYLAAIGRMVQEDLPFLSVIALLIMYIIIFETPLIILLFMYIFSREKIEDKLLKIIPFINLWNYRLTVVFLILFGMFLVIDGIGAIFGYPIINY